MDSDKKPFSASAVKSVFLGAIQLVDIVKQSGGASEVLELLLIVSRHAAFPCPDLSHDSGRNRRRGVLTNRRRKAGAHRLPGHRLRRPGHVPRPGAEGLRSAGFGQRRDAEPEARGLGQDQPGMWNVPMQKDAVGLWSVTIGPLEPEAYRYAFLVDGVRGIDQANPNVRPGGSILWSTSTSRQPPRFDELQTFLTAPSSSGLPLHRIEGLPQV